MTGLSIACENVDEGQVLMSMSVLKNRSTVLYRLMFRNFDFPRVHDYSFLGLEVNHLTLSKTNISVVEDSSLRTLARDLETLDLSYNSLKAVSVCFTKGLHEPVVGGTAHWSEGGQTPHSGGGSDTRNCGHVIFCFVCRFRDEYCRRSYSDLEDFFSFSSLF